MSDTDGALQAEAPQPSAVAMAYMIKGAVGVFGIFSIVMLWMGLNIMYHDGWRLEFQAIVAFVAVAVLAGTGMTMFLLGRRQWMKYMISITDGKICIRTPDQPVIEHVFDQTDLAGAILSRSAKRSGRSMLIVRRRKGWSIQSFTGCAVGDLTLLMDAINRRVVQHYSGFQVVLNASGETLQHVVGPEAASPAPVLPAEEPRA